MLNLPEKEREILAFWEKEKIFQKSVEKRKGKKPFIFYEGPPTANGKPGVHHVLARAYKDIILRFKTMQGFFVARKAGWDTHGLAVELEVEKELGINSKREIEKYGIENFVKKAKESVWRYKKEWEELTKRMGFWLDLEHPYITYETSYIESLWFIIKLFWEKGLLEEDFKVVPWCYRCGTPLSSHELAQGYKRVKDAAIYVKFKLEPGQKIENTETNNRTYILAWTTTPWTLPGNVALAVGENIDYMVTGSGGDVLIVASELADKIVENASRNREFTVKGSDLVGLSYEPLFTVLELQNEKAHKIYAADFVNTEEGTGVVHTSVMYGEDDYELGQKVGLPKFHTVTEEGKFIGVSKELDGKYVKSKEAEDLILKHLTTNYLLLAASGYEHDYPFCWRCSTPLLYYATKSWFLKVTKVKEKLLANNEKINWVPPHLKGGRFGNFLEEAKDWAFSRSRYWGTPLPIWRCGNCEALEVIGSLKELRQKAKPRNTFYLLRHCGAQNNGKNILSSWPEKHHYPLTDEGKCQAELLGEALKKEGIDFIVSSPLLRTSQTAEIISRIIGAPVTLDKRLREVDMGAFNGKTHADYEKFWETREAKFTKQVPDGMENFHAVKLRMLECVKELDKNYHEKKIAIISHKGPLWALEGALEGLPESEIARSFPEDFRTSEARKVFLALPFNDEGEVDLHRPYVDGVFLACKKCKGLMKRVEEVADVWFDSGAMPLAQMHFPFAQIPNSKSQIPNKFTFERSESAAKAEFPNPKLTEKLIKKLDFPADYICEAVDQTRGWFYTLLATSTLLGFGPPYKNVISLGHLLDEKGKKMSKSLGNIVDPFEAANTYGIDAIRWYFFVVNPPGFYKRFDPKEILSHKNRFLLTLFNVVQFWKLYGVKRDTKYKILNTKYNILDQWIISRLHETIEVVTNSLNKYEVPGAARELERFVDDLSNWYVRRSRERFQSGEKEAVSAILHEVLSILTELIAPFVPFSAEILYKELPTSDVGRMGSIHLQDWPKAQKRYIDAKLNLQMQFIREVCTKALALRAQAGIKVRQPIASLKIKVHFARKGSAAKAESSKFKVSEELWDLIKYEVNVKEVAFDKTIADEIELDTTLTPELLEEGFARELIRSIQDLRKQAGLVPQEKITLFVSPEIKEILEKRREYIITKTGAVDTKYEIQDTKYAKQLNFEGKRVTIAIDVEKLPRS
ncbi:MAG: class I tRNA ligase family protein [Candidatus Portnoybacteria bacterium]|nr:class I tRNA ligase family protein [Candidatus Portnoybacteria bacterium]